MKDQLGLEGVVLVGLFNQAYRSHGSSRGLLDAYRCVRVVVWSRTFPFPLLPFKVGILISSHSYLNPIS